MNKLLLGSLFVGLMVTLVVWPAVSSAATFDPNNLVSDADFTNTNTLSEQQIQDFLVSRGSGLATLSPDKLGSSDRAAKIIYDAAQSAGINPITLLVMLQKEQSLLTSTSPSQYALDHAVGYNVPDTLDTTDLYSFDAQLKGKNGWMGAAKWLKDKYQKHLGPGSYACCSDSFTVQTRSWESGDSTITPLSVATAVLYRYTPYVYNGNYNFWYLWQLYFANYSWLTNSVPADNSNRTIYATVINRQPYLVAYAGNGGMAARTLVPGTTDYPLSVCTVGAEVRVAWVASGSKEVYISNYLSHNLVFENTVDTGEQSDQGVALACISDQSYIAWKGNGNNYLNARQVGGKKTTLTDELTPLPPTLTAVTDGSLAIGWRGFGNNYINVATSTDIFATKQKTVIDTELSDTYFSIVAQGSTISVVWKGYRNTFLNIGQFNGGNTLINKHTFGDESDMTPTTAVIGGDIVISYAGRNNRALNRFNTATNDRKTVWAERVDQPPAIATDIAP